MATIDGALADPPTRRALIRLASVAMAMFVMGIVALLVALARVNGAEGHQDDLVRDGIATSALVLTVDHPVPGIDRATFAYDAGGDRRRGTLVVFNEYERGQKVTAYVAASDPGDVTLAGETPQSALSWVVTIILLLAGLVLVPMGARRLQVAARTWAVLRGHPWAPWIMQAVYPKRGRLAVSAEDIPDEHLIRLKGRTGRQLGRLERKSPLFLAGSGRWFVVTPAEGDRILALGRMDMPYQRLHLLSEGRDPLPDPGETPPAEVF